MVSKKDKRVTIGSRSRCVLFFTVDNIFIIIQSCVKVADGVSF